VTTAKVRADLERSGLLQYIDAKVAAYTDDDGWGEFCLVEAEMTEARCVQGVVTLRYDRETGELIGVVVPQSLIRLPVTEE
jgi:hypothetical protein